jgi:hypothetical protein
MYTMRIADALRGIENVAVECGADGSSVKWGVA